MNICAIGQSPFLCWVNWLVVAFVAGFGWSMGCAFFGAIVGALRRT